MWFCHVVRVKASPDQGGGERLRKRQVGKPRIMDGEMTAGTEWTTPRGKNPMSRESRDHDEREQARERAMRNEKNSNATSSASRNFLHTPIPSSSGSVELCCFFRCYNAMRGMVARKGRERGKTVKLRSTAAERWGAPRVKIERVELRESRLGRKDNEHESAQRDE